MSLYGGRAISYEMLLRGRWFRINDLGAHKLEYFYNSLSDIGDRCGLYFPIRIKWFEFFLERVTNWTISGGKWHLFTLNFDTLAAGFSVFGT